MADASSLEAAINTALITAFSGDDESTRIIQIELEGSCTDGEAKVTLYLVSSTFTPLKRLARHKLVNSALSSFLDTGGGVHALTFKCKTPEEHRKANEVVDMVED
ncbi:hypothetical protein TrLO_g14145 [Triparma laevis f. longispina]|uniref:Bola-like protein n=1 Tax=Triparma laevis f. longispina TaxID=1714387 RepID=A0A9W7C549_9STRA|nr:hypothetical protein TrLO_g14145 [Triparma laevis f. longispina]